MFDEDHSAACRTAGFRPALPPVGVIRLVPMGGKASRHVR